MFSYLLSFITFLLSVILTGMLVHLHAICLNHNMNVFETSRYFSPFLFPMLGFHFLVPMVFILQIVDLKRKQLCFLFVSYKHDIICPQQ